MTISEKTLIRLRDIVTHEIEYKSGPDLVNFFNQFGFNDSYGQGFPSRWYYAQEKLKEINKSGNIEQVIKTIFAPINFIGKKDLFNKLLNEFNEYLEYDNYRIEQKGKVVRLVELNEDDSINGDSEREFLSISFDNKTINKLDLEDEVKRVIEDRINEIMICIGNKAPLAGIFLTGSTLEGILYGLANSNSKLFNTAITCPKDKNGNVKSLKQWTLSNLIDVSYELGFLSEDVKKFSHVLRDFRNFIHPREQVKSGFNPDEHTCQICVQVLKAAIYQITKIDKSNEK